MASAETDIRCPVGHPAIPSKVAPGLLYCACNVVIKREPKPGLAVATAPMPQRAD